MAQLTQEQSRENIRRKKAMIDSGILPRNYKDMGSNTVNGNWGPWLETKYQEYLKSISKTQPLQQQQASVVPVSSALSFGRIHPALGVAAGLATAAYTNSDALQKTGEFVSNAVVPAIETSISKAWKKAKGWFSRQDEFPEESLDWKPEEVEETPVEETIEEPVEETIEESTEEIIEEPEEPKNKKDNKKKSKKPEKQKKPLSKGEKAARIAGITALSMPAATMGIDVVANIVDGDTIFNPRATKKLFDVGKGIVKRSGLTNGIVWGNDTIYFKDKPTPTITDTINTDTVEWEPISPEAQAINDSIVKEQVVWKQQSPIFSNYGN